MTHQHIVKKITDDVHIALSTQDKVTTQASSLTRHFLFMGG